MTPDHELQAARVIAAAVMFLPSSSAPSPGARCCRISESGARSPPFAAATAPYAARSIALIALPALMRCVNCGDDFYSIDSAVAHRCPEIQRYRRELAP